MEKTIDVKRAVSNGRRVTFEYYRDSQLWYSTEFEEIFPVPIEDIGNATFLKDDKAMMLMRYMNKYNKAVNSAKEPQD